MNFVSFLCKQWLWEILHALSTNKVSDLAAKGEDQSCLVNWETWVWTIPVTKYSIQSDMRCTPHNFRDLQFLFDMHCICALFQLQNCEQVFESATRQRCILGVALTGQNNCRCRCVCMPCLHHGDDIRHLLKLRQVHLVLQALIEPQLWLAGS